MSEQYVSRDEEETEHVGAEIARRLPPRGAIFLRGDLGAGKTALVRAIAKALGADEDEVSSPTFAIENEYLLPDGRTIVHLDCYRLSDREREWEEIGIPDVLRRDGLTLVEWPKPGFDRYVEAAGEIVLEVRDDETRIITLSLES